MKMRINHSPLSPALKCKSAFQAALFLRLCDSQSVSPSLFILSASQGLLCTFRLFPPFFDTVFFFFFFFYVSSLLMREKALISWCSSCSIFRGTSLLEPGITPQWALEYLHYTTKEVGLFKSIHLWVHLMRLNCHLLIPFLNASS